MNRYLYIPFRSETPRSTLKGLIKGELLRYIRRSSSLRGFTTTAMQFWHRSCARGYPTSFLAKVYDSVSYSTRDALLSCGTSASSDRLHTLCLSYSHSLAKLKLGHIVRAHIHFLPSVLLSSSNFMQTWRASRRLGSALITYNLDDPNHINDNDLSAPPLTAVRRSSL